ncbi:MAG: hypothetical protein ABI759_01865 [Candidatus Solibacter sp.]
MWEQLLDAVDLDLGGKVLELARRTAEVSKPLVCAAPKAETTVAGTRLIENKVKLVFTCRNNR